MTDYSQGRGVSPATPQLTQLERTLEKVYEVSERLARCAEAVTNPTYSVYLRDATGRTELLPVVAVRMTGGQILITVKLPEPPDQETRNRTQLEEQRLGLIQR